MLQEPVELPGGKLQEPPLHALQQGREHPLPEGYVPERTVLFLCPCQLCRLLLFLLLRRSLRLGLTDHQRKLSLHPRPWAVKGVKNQESPQKEDERDEG